MFSAAALPNDHVVALMPNMEVIIKEYEQNRLACKGIKGPSLDM
jgi:hypothetical protein